MESKNVKLNFSFCVFEWRERSVDKKIKLKGRSVDDFVAGFTLNYYALFETFETQILIIRAHFA